MSTERTIPLWSDSWSEEEVDKAMEVEREADPEGDRIFFGSFWLRDRGSPVLVWVMY